jgi:hypothetical protein
MSSVTIYRILLLTCLLFLGSNSDAQSYGSAIGIRLGNNPVGRPIGLSGQFRIARFVTIEGIAQSDFRNSHTAHVLIERHRRILSRRLNLYSGVGLSIGNEVSIIKALSTRQEITTYDNPTIGSDLIIGV